MASALICASVVTEKTVGFSGTVSCSPQFTPVALGDEFHITITSAEAVFGGTPQIEFSYFISLEYEFDSGFDYCHIRGSGSAALPDDVSECTRIPAIVDYTPTLSDITLADGILTAVLSIDFRVTVCEEQMLNVQLGP